MNIRWKLRQAVSKRDYQLGDIAILNNSKRKHPNEIWERLYPLNRWGYGYWANQQSMVR